MYGFTLQRVPGAWKMYGWYDLSPLLHTSESLKTAQRLRKGYGREALYHLTSLNNRSFHNNQHGPFVVILNEAISQEEALSIFENPVSQEAQLKLRKIQEAAMLMTIDHNQAMALYNEAYASERNFK